VVDEKDYDGKDRAEWDQAWSSMPHRRLLTPPKMEVASRLGLDWGAVVSVPIAEDPPQFSNQGRRRSEDCPVCGATTVGAQRLPARLLPTFANGPGFFFSVWVHRSCFEGCSDAGEPAPIPW
jgi:hypothetical protein